jgi:hypothetical protein
LLREPFFLSFSLTLATFLCLRQGDPKELLVAPLSRDGSDGDTTFAASLFAITLAGQADPFAEVLSASKVRNVLFFLRPSPETIRISFSKLMNILIISLSSPLSPFLTLPVADAS